MKNERDIKFRALNALNNMVYFSLFHSGLEGHTFKSQVMQFTGRIDKNGKEIYEGDILKSGIKFQNKQHQLFTVVFKFCAWYFENTKNTAATSFPSFYSNAIYLEVIGNIYENPELLNENVGMAGRE